MPSLPTRLALFLLPTLLLALPGCEWLATASERTMGKSVAAQYPGLADKSLAIVVYVPMANNFEFPQAREEISAYLTQQFRTSTPNIRLLDHRSVIAWQNDTAGWDALQVKTIGQHFATDRVLYIELLEYATREPGALNALRGYIHANVQVFETDAPGSTPAWSHEFKTLWPPVVAEDPNKSSDTTVRLRVLQSFSEQVVNAFYDHRELEKTIREKAQ